jgi:hypothetical protein
MKSLILTLATFFLVFALQAQSYTWTGNNGDWSIAANWTPARTTPSLLDTLIFNDSGIHLITSVPTQTIGALFVSDSTDITLSSSGTTTLSIQGQSNFHNLIVEGGSRFQLSGTNSLTITLTNVVNQMADISGEVIVHGGIFRSSGHASNIFTVASTGSIINTGGTITSTATTLIFQAGASYTHARNGGSIPLANWHLNSHCNITGITSTNPGNFSGHFGNITWNCPAQTSTGILSNDLTVHGILHITNGSISIGSRTLKLLGNFSANTLNGLFGNTSSNLIIEGSGQLDPLYFVQGGQFLQSLTINRTSGSVTLGSPLTLGTSNSGGLILTEGILTTDAVNYPSIQNEYTGGLSGGSAVSYVNGPLVRRIRNQNHGTFRFPVGKSTYASFDIHPTQQAGSIVTMMVEYFDTLSGGNAGHGITQIGDSYWHVQKLSGSGNIENALFTLSNHEVIPDTSVVAFSPTQTGMYLSAGGSTTTNSVMSTVGKPADGYFAIGKMQFLSGLVSTYANLTEISTYLPLMTVIGHTIFELPASYVGEPEFPVIFTEFVTDGIDDWTVTVRPESTADTLHTVGEPPMGVPLIIFEGVDRLIFDGRSGGIGNEQKWIFRNTRIGATSPTFRFINDATYNTLTYLIVEGKNTTTTASNKGTINFSTGISLGNSNNTISYCHIKDLDHNTSKPEIGIYSLGSSTTVSNKENEILNNEIYDFFRNMSTAGMAAGVQIGNNSSDWNISGNHFYHSEIQNTNATGSSYTINLYGIYISSTNGNGFQITDNFIGGSQAHAGGNPWSITSTFQTVNTYPKNLFSGIYLNVGSNIASSVQNNTISNFEWNSLPAENAIPGIWNGIYVHGGNVEIGTLSGNIIGDTSGVGSVVINTTSFVSVSSGIATSSSETLSIENNTIGSITTETANFPNRAHGFNGIWNSGNAQSILINNNVIGSTSTPQSIHATNAYHNSSSTQEVNGIFNTGNSADITISNNIIANLYNHMLSSTATPNTVHPIRGIYTTSGVNNIVGNTIFNLSTQAYASGSSGESFSVVGILNTSTVNTGLIIKGNTIHSLSNTNPDQKINIAGIYNTGATTGTHDISQNFIHSLDLKSTNTTSSMSGIYVNSGRANYSNNMIRLGIDPNGNDIQQAYQIDGVRHHSNTAGNNYYYNTVYIGGNQVSTGVSNTAAFSRLGGTNAINLLNNILINERSNNTSSGEHFGLRLSNIDNTTSNYNLLNANGNGGITSQAIGINYPTLNHWQTFGFDTSSITGVVHFINELGNAHVVDLHIDLSIPAIIESAGTIIPEISIDFDSDLRYGATGYTGTGTAPDIGADEENFIPYGVNIFTIDYTHIPDQTTLTAPDLQAHTISTGGIETMSGLAPRLYFKRSTDNNTYVDNTNVSNGWKYVESASTSSPFSFTIDYSLLQGNITGGEIIEYFVIAQDTLSPVNIAINNGVFNTLPASVDLTATNFPLTGSINDYLIDVTTVNLNQLSSIETKIFPNPANNELFVQIQDIEVSQSEITIINTYGQIVFQEKADVLMSHSINSRETIVIQISHLPQGIYGFILTHNHNSIFSKTFVIIN